jgi:hypothetical protein
MIDRPMVRCCRAEKCRCHQACVARQPHHRMGVEGYACQCSSWHVCRTTGAKVRCVRVKEEAK